MLTFMGVQGLRYSGLESEETVVSKPLVFVLQLIGLGMLFAGYASDPKDPFMIVMGVVLVLGGGVALRKRFKKGG